MKLTQIIENISASLEDREVHVNINPRAGFIDMTVEGISFAFLQGDEALEFLQERDKIWDELGDVSLEQVALYLADKYTVLMGDL